MVPPPLVLSQRRVVSQAPRGALSHHHMSPAQFRRGTTELFLPEGIYRLYDHVVKDCEVCQKTKPAPPRARFSGVRTVTFGATGLMDHCEIKHLGTKHQLYLVLDGDVAQKWTPPPRENIDLDMVEQEKRNIVSSTQCQRPWPPMT